jgi:hypothetical protein
LSLFPIFHCFGPFPPLFFHSPHLFSSFNPLE